MLLPVSAQQCSRLWPTSRPRPDQGLCGSSPISDFLISNSKYCLYLYQINFCLWIGLHPQNNNKKDPVQTTLIHLLNLLVSEQLKTADSASSILISSNSPCLKSSVIFSKTFSSLHLVSEASRRKARVRFYTPTPWTGSSWDTGTGCPERC